MVSRRKLFSILLMMAVLLSMFMLPQIYREVFSDYDTNSYAEEIVLFQSDAYTMQEEAEPSVSGRQVVFIGDKESDMGNIAAQWCTYTKRSLKCFSSLSDYASQKKILADVLCVDCGSLSLKTDSVLLDQMTGRDMVMIFGSLPKSRVIRTSPEFSRLLGIERVVQEHTDLEGINVYEGFLLGGEAVYQADTKEETKRQDLNLTVPWYKLGDRSKVYMAGITEETGRKEDGDPAIVWRNTAGKAKVFAVNGDYLCGETGLGFLDAMMTETQAYTIYPVVNAQNLSVGSYPCLSSENDETIGQIYSCSQVQLHQNIVWPSLIAISEQSGFHMTCFLTPRFVYSGGSAPDPELLDFYLRQMKERHGDAGWSAESRNEISVRTKNLRDEKFFEKAGNGYVYTAAYASQKKRKELSALADAGKAGDIRTVTGPIGDGDFLLSFLSENMTYQGITHDADTYKYSDDLRNRSIQTALGYTNILLDMERVSWPEGIEDQWERYSREAAGNIGMWWSLFSDFDKTTITESDSRLRSFFALDYKDSREGDVITLQIENRQGDVSFLLRTHDKNVASVSGGTFSKIEKDAYLIRAQEDEVSICLEN